MVGQRLVTLAVRECSSCKGATQVACDECRRSATNCVVCSCVSEGQPEAAGPVADLDLVDHEAHGSAYAEMLAHGVVVEVCEVSEFGHTNRSSRIGDRAKEAMAGRIPRRPRVGLGPSCGTSPRRSSSVCQNYM